MKEIHRKLIFGTMQVIGIFAVAFISMYQFAYTKGGETAIENCKEFIYNNCTCLGYNTNPNYNEFPTINGNLTFPIELPS